MKFTYDSVFAWPLERIVPLLAHEELVDFEDLPNVNARKVIERRREGNKTYKVYEWDVHGKIPKPAQMIIRQGMLAFTEYTVWDDDTCVFDIRIEPHHLKNVFNVTTSSTWSAVSETETKRHIETAVEVNIPVVGPLLERTVLEHIRRNTEKATEVMRRALAARLDTQTA